MYTATKVINKKYGLLGCLNAMESDIQTKKKKNKHC